MNFMLLIYKYMVFLFFIFLLIFIRVKKKEPFNFFFYLCYGIILGFMGIYLFKESVYFIK